MPLLKIVSYDPQLNHQLILSHTSHECVKSAFIHCLNCNTE